MIEKAIFFKNLNKKSYQQPVGCPDINDVCDEVKDSIIQDAYDDLNDLITEVADSNVDVYTADLLSTCSKAEMIPYLDSTLDEFGKFTSIEQLYRVAEYNYYYTELYNNIDTIIQNSLIEYLSNKSLTINAEESELDSIKSQVHDFVDNYISTSSYANYNLGSIIDNFNDKFAKFVSDLSEEKTITSAKFSESSEDDEPEGIKALFIEVGKEPEIIYLSEKSEDRLPQLQALVGGNIECLSLDSLNKEIGVDIVLNEEGKLIGLEPNILLREKYFDRKLSNKICDVVVGNAILIGVQDCDFVSLPENEIEHWSAEFSQTKTPYIGSLYLDDEHESTIFDEYENHDKSKHIDDMDFGSDFDER